MHRIGTNALNPFERDQVATLLSRLREEPRRIIALSGPRQSGKTTIVRQALARLWEEDRVRGLYFAADEPQPELGGWPTASTSRTMPFGTTGRLSTVPGERLDVRWIVRRWEAARAEAERAGRAVLVLDEIQRVPQWSTPVKGLWDRDRMEGYRLHVVVLGSAPLLMQSGLSESLVGRVERLPVPHWSLAEMAAAFGFGLDEFLFFGGYPGTADLIQDLSRWRQTVADSITRTIERDVASMSRVNRPAVLRNLFDAAAAYSAQPVTLRALLGELDSRENAGTVARYLDLLESAELIAGLRKHRGEPVIRRSPPKLIVLNTALMTAPTQRTPAGARADRSYWGRIVESALGAHLHQTRGPGIHLGYWRDDRREVDFVLRGEGRVLGIEVKSGRARGGHVGLAAFRRRFPGSRTLLVGEGGVEIADFLSEPAAYWLEHDDR